MEGKSFLSTILVSDLPKVEIISLHSDVTCVDALKVLFYLCSVVRNLLIIIMFT